MATLDPASVEEQISITDEMIGSYYDNNPMLYQLEESADVQYVEIQRSDIAESVAVTEDELTQYYEESKDRYLQDEQRQARHILVLFNDDEAAAEAKAEELLGRINAGEAFDAIAAESSDDIATANQGGDLGVRTRSQLPGNLGRAIFAMDEGDVTGPVKTDFGFHIVRLDSILEQGALPFEQVRAELTAELQDEKAESMFRDLERRMSDALFDATTIEELATAIDMEIQTLEGFTRSGVAPFEGNLAVIDAIFDEIVLTGEQMSEIIEIDSRRSAVFAVTSHRPATRQSLEDVREQVAEALKADMAEALMAAKADEMIAALDGGAEFAAAAEAIGATPADPVIMTRDNQDADQFVAVAVFTAVKPTQDNPTTGSTRNGEGGYTVYSIEAVLPGRPEVVPVEQRDAGKLQLTDQAGIGEFIAFVQSLREGSEVIINEDALAAQDLL
jgi:peptidyl-prolyl cis-trans isomerase D